MIQCRKLLGIPLASMNLKFYEKMIVIHLNEAVILFRAEHCRVNQFPGSLGKLVVFMGAHGNGFIATTLKNEEEQLRKLYRVNLPGMEQFRMLFEGILSQSL